MEAMRGAYRKREERRLEQGSPLLAPHACDPAASGLSVPRPAGQQAAVRAPPRGLARGPPPDPAPGGGVGRGRRQTQHFPWH